MVSESRLERTEHGLALGGDGWYVLNLREAEWRHADGRGAVCVAADDFEGGRRPLQLGVNVFALAPGEPMAMYHRENAQEGFLVVAGTCLLIVEGEERALATWDFFHCPPQTEHVIVGAGDGPALVLAVGARGGRKEIVYPVAPAALAHGAGVEQETTSPAEAYARFPPSQRSKYRDGWLPDL